MKFSCHRRVSSTLIICSFFAFVVGCRGCFTDDSPKTVASCSDFDNKEDLCNNGSQHDGKACQFDAITSACMVADDSEKKDCEQMDHDECRASRYCTFNEVSKVCIHADPTTRGQCNVIQVEDVCTADEACKWNKTTLQCDNKI